MGYLHYIGVYVFSKMSIFVIGSVQLSIKCSCLH